MRVSLVAAVARNGVIGRDGTVPWRLPEDLARFREITMGHAVVMGRRTWESIPDRFRPLPGRRNVVVTRNPHWHDSGAEPVRSFEEALDRLENAPNVFVIGGGEIYAAALPMADELLLTEVDAEIEGDTYFPSWDREVFEEESRESHVSSNGMPFSFVGYRRRSSEDSIPERDVESQQLSALASVDALLEQAGIVYWLFGGWAVDFHAGSVTRAHDDIDLAVWLEDLPRISTLLEENGWSHAPSEDDDGGTGFEQAAVRLELTYLARDDQGRIVTPLRSFEAPWPDGAFGDDVRELLGARVRLVGLESLAKGKSSPRDDPDEAAKDRADFDVLSGI